MLPKDFFRQCKMHDWDWRRSDDASVRSRGSANEHRLKRIAEESSVLRAILDQHCEARRPAPTGVSIFKKKEEE